MQGSIQPSNTVLDHEEYFFLNITRHVLDGVVGAAVGDAQPAPPRAGRPAPVGRAAAVSPPDVAAHVLTRRGEEAAVVLVRLKHANIRPQ